MKFKALEFRIIPLILLGVALSFPLQAAWVFGHSLLEWEAIFQKLTALNWLVVASCAAAAISVSQVSKVSVVLVPLALVSVIANNIIVGLFNFQFSLTETTVASAAFSMALVPLLRPAVRTALLDKRQRWWRSDRRVKRVLQARIAPFYGRAFEGLTFDVSQSGAFVCLPDQQEWPELGPGGRLDVKLLLGQLCHIQCEAVVVRKAAARGGYPAGLGLRFVDLSSDQQKFLKKYISSVDVSS